MHQAVIRFRFGTSSATQLAQDTLSELGYDAVIEPSGDCLHIHIERQDLTSALEIAEAHGGQLIEEAPLTETAVMSSAYGIDCIPIPAHIVNEDWVDRESYSTIDPTGDDLSHRDEEATGWNDEHTNQFQGGIHL
ncbi:hypothetical protein [Paenibacillus assamensis]|uniref:hypothetical protein n=1 Tax=Paenibacillus assamensis TaxID=311244 RepID=UPI00040B5C3D|nr:hypothetical protein [Paenibacillus assamensis]